MRHGKARRFTAEQDAIVRRENEAGRSTAEIARMMGVTAQTIWSVKLRLGLTSAGTARKDWTAIDPVILAGYRAGTPTREIAARCGILPSAVQNRARYLGFKHANVEKDGRRRAYSEAEELLAAELRRAGLRLPAIAARLPGRSTESVRFLLGRLPWTHGLPGHVEAPSINDRPARRRCLTCGEMFDSDGPHHRICDGHGALVRLAASLPDSWTGVKPEPVR